MPDGTSRFSLDGKKLHHYMGTSTFSNFTVLPEIAVAKIREDAPFDKVCYIGCGVTTGIGAVLNTAKVEPGAKCIVFGLGGIGLNVIQGLRLAGADMIIGVDVNDGKKAWGERFGMTHFVNPKEVGGDLVAHLVNMTKRGADQIGGADYTFDCTGNVTVMRQALEACHRGWGQSIIIGVAPAGAEIATRPFQLVTGRVWKGTAFGGARGPHRRAEDRRLVHGGQDRDRPDDHPHDAARRNQQGVRPDARGQEHPQRGGVLGGTLHPSRLLGACWGSVASEPSWVRATTTSSSYRAETIEKSDASKFFLNASWSLHRSDRAFTMCGCHWNDANHKRRNVWPGPPPSYLRSASVSKSTATCQPNSNRSLLDATNRRTRCCGGAF